MNLNFGESMLLPPRVTPVVDPWFRPAALVMREVRKQTSQLEDAPLARLALEQTDGSVSEFSLRVFPENHAQSTFNGRLVERLLKFHLWARGGFRIHVDAPPAVVAHLERYFSKNPRGQFDDLVIGHKVYDRALEVFPTKQLPSPRSSTAPLGRHLDGNRIGFDLGGSDRKVAALVDGEVVFSEEVVWDPIKQSNPQYHFDGIMDSLKRAAAHLPSVDAIGGSAAGVYVNNRVKVASLFRAVSPPLFESRVKNLFLEIKEAWHNLPFALANDGEVTALAGSMALGKNAVLGIAMGTSMAAGYVTRDGNITSWLNELAFAPVDFRTDGPVDEWSGDSGCGVQYFSQQCVGRLLAVAGIDVEATLPLPEKLLLVQELMQADDYRARKIYQTIGVYLGYSIAFYREFYDFEQLLVLGRVTTGAGGSVIVEEARKVLDLEFPEVSEQIDFHVPDEKEKRHGQAIAAASLPVIHRA